MKKLLTTALSLFLIIALAGCSNITKLLPVPTLSTTATSETEPETETETETAGYDLSQLNISQLAPTSTDITNYDAFPKGLNSQGKSSILVIIVSFTDGYDIDKEYVQDFFTGDYGPDDYMRSVSSYYKYTSYGRDLFDFTFVYYDSNMSSQEAWYYVNDPNSPISDNPNQLMFDIYEELHDSGELSKANLDQNHDGYIDSTIFIFADNYDGCQVYGSAMGTENEYPADASNPVISQYVKSSYSYLVKPLEEGSYDHENTRVFIHEIGHLFGLVDYYDCYEYEDTITDTLGAFDMQSNDTGDWNPFSKFSCGWLEPMVITPDIETITLKLRCSSLYNDAILIPTSKGWNGTPYDEYILIDVIAQAGANGFDWDIIQRNNDYQGVENPTNGGVRLLHVDARLLKFENGNFSHFDDISQVDWGNDDLSFAYCNSNGFDPYLEEDSRFYHLIDLIPADGSSKFRISTFQGWSLYAPLTSADLFTTGDEFSVDTHAEAFANDALMNNGATLDYNVKVEYYDSANQEAYVTITRK